jgi:predicted RNA-binding Zn-ribbon protein involved in translation (DUF1610 family)
MSQVELTCEKCNGKIEFKPGAEELVCPFCGHTQPLPETDETVEEQDFFEALSKAEDSGEMEEISEVKCATCGAEMSLDANVTDDLCPYCGVAISVAPTSRKLLKPQSLLPFKVPSDEAMQAFKDWILSRWFAPNDLKHYCDHAKALQGMYVPFWTYDARTTTIYTGQRGEYYYVTQTYTTTVNGKTVTRTRRVRRTRWYPASGTVCNSFDDILVLASKNLDKKRADALEPWDLENLQPHSEQYLMGFRTEAYQVDLEEGFAEARGRMIDPIRQAIRRDIGGDTQRIHSMTTHYDDITFKHILLPVWLSAYRYQEKVYQFMINARTGEVQGERPWSWIKITLAALGAAAVIGGIVTTIVMMRG